MTGTLAADARWGMALRDLDGALRKVIWPFGYSARATSSGVVLLDERGVTVGREGDRVEVGGGEIDNAGTWIACAGIRVVPA